MTSALPPVAEQQPASPCVAVCALDDVTGYCRGCWRSITEIASWPHLTADAKRGILAELPERRAGSEQPVAMPNENRQRESGEELHPG